MEAGALVLPCVPSGYRLAVERQGTPEDRDRFHMLLGRYVSAAGHAEWAMWVLLRELQRFLGLPVPTEQPTWAALVKALRALPETAYSAELQEALRGAERRGRLRNDRVHTAWWVVRENGYVSRRGYAQKGKDSVMMLWEQGALDNDVRMMEQFATRMERLAGQVQHRRR